MTLEVQPDLVVVLPLEPAALAGTASIDAVIAAVRAVIVIFLYNVCFNEYPHVVPNLLRNYYE